MDFETARRVLMVASAEEGDEAGEYVPHELRRKATDAAPDPGEPSSDDERFTAAEAAFFAARAEAIVAASGLPDRLRPLRVGVLLGGAVLVAVMLAIGFLSKGLGKSGVVNVLMFPLLAVMLWNVVMYLFAAIRVVRGGNDSEITRAFSTIVESKEMSDMKRRSEVLAAPVRLAWLKTILHLGAAAIAVGAVAGMYYQGLVRDYQATWESTFLSAEQVRGILSVALAPATWFPGLALPDVAGIEAIRDPGSERAAAWIHRYALAASVVVILPRLVLAARSALRARSIGGSLPLREAAPKYFKTLLAEKRGVKAVVRVVPHRVELDSAARDSLRTRLHDHWGGALWMDFLDAVPYGEEESFAARASELKGADHVAVVCGLSATPEDESQGRLLRAVRDAAGGGEVLLALDDGGFAERFGEARAGERLAAWQKLADGCDIELLSDES